MRFELSPHVDERGYFARVWDADELSKLGIDTTVSQCSLAHNNERGTLRGMHYQLHPCTETKLVVCVRGSVFDVVLDLRDDSSTFGTWQSFELRAGTAHCALYIPAGIAHGYLTLEDHSCLYYQIGGRYAPELARGVRWNDPMFSIDWPCAPAVISRRDATFGDFSH
jgi:dTDP-4-dehydrorhamnose 3,5-epimerase